MRTALIILSLSALSAFGQAFSFNDHEAWLAQQKAGGGGATCSPTQGNLLTDEGFETATTGYQLSGWQTAVGSPNPAFNISALTTAKPNGSCNQGLQVDYTGSAIYAWWDSGSDHAAVMYLRFYFYISANSISDGFAAPIAGVYTGNVIADGNRVATIVLGNTGGQLQLYGHGGTDSAKVNVSSGTWILVEAKVNVGGVAAGSELKINGGTAQTFNDSGYGNWRSISIGCHTTPSFANYTGVYDLVAASSTGYIGGTP